MMYDPSKPHRFHSTMSEAALGVAVVAIAAALLVAGAVYVQRNQVIELEERYHRQHEELVELRTRTERLDAIVDRAIDSASIARAIVEESRNATKGETKP